MKKKEIWISEEELKNLLQGTLHWSDIDSKSFTPISRNYTGIRQLGEPIRNHEYNVLADMSKQNGKFKPETLIKQGDILTQYNGFEKTNIFKRENVFDQGTFKQADILPEAARYDQADKFDQKDILSSPNELNTSDDAVDLLQLADKTISSNKRGLQGHAVIFMLTGVGLLTLATWLLYVFVI